MGSAPELRDGPEPVDQSLAEGGQYLGRDATVRQAPELLDGAARARAITRLAVIVGDFIDHPDRPVSERLLIGGGHHLTEA